MKKFLKVIWGIFAVIGILATAGLIYARIGNYYFSIHQSRPMRYDLMGCSPTEYIIKN